MSHLKKILGSSLISLLVAIWGLFMVCSGRVPEVNYEDEFDFADESGVSGESSPDLMTQLAVLDDDSNKLEDAQRREILEALGLETTSSSTKAEEAFLTEELFLNLEVEIAELEKQSRRKSEIVDSLKSELQETDIQLTALERVVGPSGQLATTTATAPKLTSTGGSVSNYALQYQDALNEVYAHRYVEAIAKFQDLLRQNDADELSDNCQYWIGESYFALGNYQLAIAEFEKVFAFEQNNKSDDAQFMIGMAYLKMGDPLLAQLELNNLLTFYQDSEYVARAERQLIDLNI
jgi:TolA-binding protein